MVSVYAFTHLYSSVKAKAISFGKLHIIHIFPYLAQLIFIHPQGYCSTKFTLTGTEKKAKLLFCYYNQEINECIPLNSLFLLCLHHLFL